MVLGYNLPIVVVAIMVIAVMAVDKKGEKKK